MEWFGFGRGCSCSESESLLLRRSLMERISLGKV